MATGIDLLTAAKLSKAAYTPLQSVTNVGDWKPQFSYSGIGGSDSSPDASVQYVTFGITGTVTELR